MNKKTTEFLYRSLTVFVLLGLLLSPWNVVWAKALQKNETPSTTQTPTDLSAQTTPKSDTETITDSSTSETADETTSDAAKPAATKSAATAKTAAAKTPMAADALTITAQNNIYTDKTFNPALSLKTDSVTGALTYEFPLVTPPGRNNVDPDLKLTYDSQNTEQNSLLGYGWSLNIPYIERVNKFGINNLYSTTSPQYFNSSLSGELQLNATSTSGDTYISRIEKGDFYNYVFANNQWAVTDKFGTQYFFGTTTAGRQDEVATTTKTFKWMLQRQIDTNGNYIDYTYFKDAGQIYPNTITYTGNGNAPGIFVIKFIRESRTDTATSYKTGFKVTTNYRINSIQALTSNVLTRSWTLAYTTAAPSVRSLLQSIQETASDSGNLPVSLPATQFEYQKTTDTNPVTTNLTFPTTLNSAQISFVDINGDSIGDLFSSYNNGAGTEYRFTYLGDGRGGWTKSNEYTPPKTFYVGTPTGLGGSGYTLSDVNGDGLVDIFNVDGLDNSCGGYCPGRIWLYRNTGNGWVVDENWRGPYQQFMLGTQGFSLTDVNADGLPDLIQATDKIIVFINTGTSWATTSIPWGNAYQSNSPGQKFADINGDGILDSIISYSNDVYEWPAGYRTLKHYELQATYLGLGDGTFQESVDYKPPTFFQYVHQDWGCTDNCTYDTGVRIYDYNGDSLPDLVQSVSGMRMAGGSSYTAQLVYLNTGKGWSSPINITLPDYFSNGGLFATNNDFADITGDGVVDFITKNPFAMTTLKPKQNAFTVLNKITHSTGAISTVDYTLSSKYIDRAGVNLNPKLSQIFPTVSALGISAQLNGPVATTTYTYAGGIFYTDGPINRRFAGFDKITETDPQGYVTITYNHGGATTNPTLGEYADSYYKFGRPYRVEQKDNLGNIYKTVVNKWDSTSLATTSAFVYLAQTTTLTYDGTTSHKDTATTYSYDLSNGNLKQKIEYGEVLANNDGSFTDTGTDNRTTTITYISIPKFRGLPLIEHMTDQVGSQPVETRHYYDGLQMGLVSKGNETKTQRSISAGTYSTQQKTYNTQGLVIQETDPLGNITKYTYDSTHLYPVTVTNPLNQQTKYTYSYSLGKPTQVTYPNGGIIQTAYDGLGRPVTIRQSDDAVAIVLVTKATYTYSDTTSPRSVRENQYISSTLYTQRYQYIDGLNRVIQERRSDADSSTYYDVVDSAYDSRGLLVSQSQPYQSLGTTQTQPTATTTLLTTYTNDALGRPTVIVDAAGTQRNTYTPWKVTMVDRRGKTKDLYSDAHGNLSGVDEKFGSTIYSTRYTYTSLNKLKNITDALGNVRNFNYDALGNLLKSEDLHAPTDTVFGIWTYKYDVAGNLISTTDPRSTTINYVYDSLNRVISEDAPTTTGIDQAYTYDTCQNGIGYLCQAAGALATTTYKYNPRGMITDENKTIVASAYRTQYAYDIQGNLTQLTYPDGSIVRYSYNVGGKPEVVTFQEAGAPGAKTILSAMDYTPTGATRSYYWGNGTKLIRGYSTNYLYRLVSQNITVASSTLAQSITYGYDPNGNITQLKNVGSAVNAGTVIYTYDDLNRLSSASTTSTTSPTYKQQFTYNAIGNLMSNNLGTYSYWGTEANNYANPHAATIVSATTTNGTSTKVDVTKYSYDQAGNMLNASTTGLMINNNWDYKNRLAASLIQAGTSTPTLSTVTYLYDHTDARIRYTYGTSTRISPNKYYSTGPTGVLRNIFVGDQLVATIAGTGASSTVNYVHPDHLGGTSLVTNEAGVVIEALDYYPFGGIRVDAKTTSFDERNKYTGHEFDAATGYNYMQARYQDPRIGRFLSQDPAARDVPQKFLSDPQQLNFYSYARNNPIVFVDPSGQSLETGIQGAAHAALTGIGVGLIAFAVISTAEITVPAAIIVGLSAGGLGLTGLGAYSNNKAYSEGSIDKDTYDYNNGALIVDGAASIVGLAGGISSLGGAKVPQIKLNAQQGKAFADAKFSEFLSEAPGAVRELPVRTSSGTLLYLDAVASDSKSGNLKIQEYKSSKTAGFTNNQKKGFPELKSSGATVVGSGKPGFPAGTSIPPTTVNVIRP